MKKVLSIVVAVLMMLGVFGVCAFAADVQAADPISVYVTVSDGEGKLALAQERVTVTDINSDGKLDINEALYAAHEAKYVGGADAGYKAETTDYGLSLKKLWGVVNGDGYGYCLNNASAWSLGDTVKDGDYVNAYVYTDLDYWSDMYVYFDANAKTATVGDSVTLTLSGASYDASYNPITVPVKDATITVDGVATNYKTDENGKVTVVLNKAGELIISATSETQTLVPPVCKVTVTSPIVDDTNDTDGTEPTSEVTAADTAEDTDSETTAVDNGCGGTIFISVSAVAAASVIAAVTVKRKNEE